MKRNRTMALWFVLFFLSFSCKENGEIPKQDTSGYKVLFIGSSYFDYNNLPGIVQKLAESTGKKIYIERDIINGTYLDYHSQSEQTKEKIKKYKWDFVLLQDAGTNIGYPEDQHLIFPPYQKRDIYTAIKDLSKMIRDNCRESKIILMMPWAFEDGTVWLKDQHDTFSDMQKKIYNNSIKYAKDFDIMLAPVGWAWYNVVKQNDLLHYLFLSDYNHPNIRGSYLSACVIYCATFQGSVVGNTFTSDLSKEDVKYFQQIASATVLDSLSVWNIK